MKLSCFAVAILAIAPLVRAQDAPPKVEPPPDVAGQKARVQEEKRAVDEANARAQRDRAEENVRRAAQAQQQGGGGFGGGGGGVMRYTPQRLNAKPVKGAWLGLTASKPPAALRHQLKLPDGTGLVVDFVQPKSPADQAGIKQYDLLTRLNEQVLVNPEQLAVLVRTFKPNDEIKLAFFREGDQRTQSVTLAETNLAPLEDLQFQFDNLRYNLVPRDQNNPFGGAPQGAGGGGGFGGGGGIGGGGIGGGGFGGGPGGGGAAPSDLERNVKVERSEHSLTWLDGRQQITVNLDGDSNTITVTDNRSKKVLYQGSIDAANQQKSLSPETRGAIDRVRAFLKSKQDSADKNSENRPSGS